MGSVRQCTWCARSCPRHHQARRRVGARRRQASLCLLLQHCLPSLQRTADSVRGHCLQLRFSMRVWHPIDLSGHGSAQAHAHAHATQRPHVCSTEITEVRSSVPDQPSRGSAGSRSAAQLAVRSATSSAWRHIITAVLTMLLVPAHAAALSRYVSLQLDRQANGTVKHVSLPTVRRVPLPLRMQTAPATYAARYAPRSAGTGSAL